MTTANRRVLDISHHNEVTSWSAMKDAGIVGVIHKATEGTSYEDPMYQNRREEALRHGLLWGAYHFATASSPQGQAQNFLDVAGIDDHTLYALDWEDYGDDTMSMDQAVTFMRFIDQEIGHGNPRCVLYSGNTAKEALGSDVSLFFGAHRLWLAQYGSSPVPQPSWPSEWLWQYSDGNVGPSPHGCPGVTGDVDTNSWAGTDEELKAQWSGALVLPPPLLIEQPERANVIMVSAMSRTIVLVDGRVVTAQSLEHTVSRRGEKGR